MSDLISRQAVIDEFADWYGFNYQSQWYYKRIKSMAPVNPKTDDMLEYLEIAYANAKACADITEQVRLARAIKAYKKPVSGQSI